MTLDDNQATIRMDDERHTQVMVSRNDVSGIQMSVFINAAHVTAFLDPKRARELAAALIAYAGDES